MKEVKLSLSVYLDVQAYNFFPNDGRNVDGNNTISACIDHEHVKLSTTK